MFTVVFSVSLLAEPQSCKLRPAALPRQETFSECLQAAGNEAALFSRQNRSLRIEQIYCVPRQPGKGR
jgi:hypothetical protein